MFLNVFHLDELQLLLKSTIDLADQLSDNSSEWLLIEHRLQSIKEKFDFLFVRTNRDHRELKVCSSQCKYFFSKSFFFSQTNLVQTEDIRHAMVDINGQLDHLETLNQSLEPVDENESNPSLIRTKLHRFIRIHDDLEILNERLITLNERSLALFSGDQLRVTNDLKLLLDRLNSIKRIVRIYLDRLEKLLAKTESPLRTSNGNLQVTQIYLLKKN